MNFTNQELDIIEVALNKLQEELQECSDSLSSDDIEIPIEISQKLKDIQTLKSKVENRN